MEWKVASCVLCDEKIPIRLKGKFHKTMVRLAVMYGSEFGHKIKKMEQNIRVTMTIMFRWMSGVSRKDRIRNEFIRTKNSSLLIISFSSFVYY